MAKYILTLFYVCTFFVLHAQTNDTTQLYSLPLSLQVGKIKYGKDSIAHVILPTLHKYPALTFKDKKEEHRYNRFVYNIKKTLPIAKLIKQTMIETYDYIETLPTKEERQAHIDYVEKGLKKQYTPLLKQLTFSQGKLLIKLVDRECGQTSYEMVKAFIGPFRASMYQVFAGLFGASLKKQYDPNGEDKFTERVVLMVESGQL